MDELQRRITTAASVFASVTTLFVLAASHLLVVAGVIPVRFQATAGFVIIWLVVCFYLLGRGIFNRRYQWPVRWTRRSFTDAVAARPCGGWRRSSCFGMGG